MEPIVASSQQASDGMSALVPILGRYLFIRFLSTILIVFGIAALLIYILDVIELTRIANDASLFALLSSAKLSFLRTPVIMEQVLPFAGFFGALWAFLGLARSRELVVARAAGVSVWQFLLPPLFAAAIIGAFSMLVFNPLSAYLKAMSEEALSQHDQAYMAGHGGPVWIRQRSVDGDAILRASATDMTAARFTGVTAFEFDHQGVFQHRIEAREAELLDGYWLLHDARVITVGVPPELHAAYELPTYLTRAQMRQTLQQAEAISFYDLPAWAKATEAAGLDSARYVQQFDALLARPALLAAMLLLAATVSLRFSRTGAQVTTILIGILAVFSIFVVNKVMTDLGSAGLLSPLLTAFITPGAASLLSAVFLLYQEDG